MEATYTIKVEPSRSPGKVTATSSDGHTFTTSMCILDGARYWGPEDQTVTIVALEGAPWACRPLGAA